MSKIDDIFSMFADGKPHDLQEVVKRASMPEPVVRKVLDFLAEFNFITFDKAAVRAKIIQ